MNKNARPFLDARDQLLKNRDDHLLAANSFEWPELKEFNWALDYFDELANNNHANALHIVNEDGSEFIRSFQELSHRSAQVANYLKGLGIRRGDHVLLMMGNILPLPSAWHIVHPASKKLSPLALAFKQHLLNEISRRKSKLLNRINP